jgi:hypothetical protein
LSITPGGWNNARHRFHVPVSGDTSVWSYNYNGSAVDYSGYATSSITVAQGNVYIATGNSNTAPSTVATFNNTGLGIGTAPTAKFEVNLVGTANLANATITKITDFAAGSRAGFRHLLDNNDGVYFGTGANNHIGSGFGFFRESGGWNTAIAFYTNNITSGPNGTSAIQEKMRLNSDGWLGIGNKAPEAKLHISTSNSAAFNAADNSWHSVIVNNQASAGTHASGICFVVANQPYFSNAGTGIAAVKNGINSDYGSDLVFITRGQSVVASEKMRINSTGGVSIGTTANSHFINIASAVGSSSGQQNWNGVKEHAISGYKAASTQVKLRLWIENYSSCILTMTYAHTNGGNYGAFIQVFVNNSYGTIYTQVIGSKLSFDAGTITTATSTPVNGATGYYEITFPTANASAANYTATATNVTGSNVYWETL